MKLIARWMWGTRISPSKGSSDIPSPGIRSTAAFRAAPVERGPTSSVSGRVATGSCALPDQSRGSARLIDDAEAPALGRLRSSAAAPSAQDGGERYVAFPIAPSVAFGVCKQSSGGAGAARALNAGTIHGPPGVIWGDE